nr:hypothetical protein [Tanacetum cinerariifolium]
MAITIEQQVALDEALVPNVSKIYMQEFWATAKLHQHSIRFKMDTRKHVLDLEAFREMLHISPRIPGQSFVELPFKEEILEFLRFLGHSAEIKTLTDVNVNKLYQPWRSFAAVINKCLTGKSSGIDSLRDVILFSTIKVVSRHQDSQQYGAILPIELTIEDIKNTKAYQEYYAYATGEAAPKPKASARKKKGKQPARATSPTDPLDVERTEAEQLKIVLRRSRQETHISQQRGSSTDEGTDEAEKVNDDDDDEEEIPKIGEQEVTESDEGEDDATESDGESEEEETKEHEEESFDPIPRTPEDSEDDDNNEEDQGLRIGEDERIREEEEADELYRDVDINQGWGLQVSQETEDSHVILTPTQSNGQQESSSTSSFVTNLLNPIINPADLSEMELKKILIEKMEGNKEGGEHASANTLSEPATGSAGRHTTGTQSRQLSASESAFAEEPVQTTCQMEEPSHPVFEIGAEDQPIVQTSQHPEWFSQPKKPPTSDHTPIDFSNFIMNRLGVDTLTPELLAGPTYELMRGSCNSLIELEYHLEEVYKATTDQLDWVNPEGKQYPHNLLQPLSLIPDNRGRREPINYDKYALWEVSHWGRKCQQFYGFAVNRESALDVYSKRRIIVVTDLKIVAWHDYKHLDWISIRRDDDKIYKFKEGDFKRLRLQDIEDMLLLLVQGKLSNLTVEERFAFNISLRMFTSSIVI